MEHCAKGVQKVVKVAATVNGKLFCISSNPLHVVYYTARIWMSINCFLSSIGLQACIDCAAGLYSNGGHVRPLAGASAKISQPSVDCPGH